LVGHTDASGSLAANIAVSERRAEAVAQVLIDRYGVDRDRVTAEGVGFLAPRATNQTEEGRQKNRRVEVVVTSTR
jgi:outer membrane protein OmpA-like peptidoglycan-associated protein